MRPVAEPAQIMNSTPPDHPDHHGSLPWDPAVQMRAKYIRVINHGDTAFTDRHDGVPVTIDPGGWENLPLDMAEHFFGYHDGVNPEMMFRHVCKRQGWNTPAHIKMGDNGKTLAQDLFSKLEIKPVTFKLVEEKVDIEAPILADPQPEAEDQPKRKKAS